MFNLFHLLIVSSDHKEALTCHGVEFINSLSEEVDIRPLLSSIGTFDAEDDSINSEGLLSRLLIQ